MQYLLYDLRRLPLEERLKIIEQVLNNQALTIAPASEKGNQNFKDAGACSKPNANIPKRPSPE